MAANGTCDDLVLMTGEGLRRLLGFARRIDLEPAFLDALRTTRKITRGPKPVRALREIGLDTDSPTDEPTTEGIIAAMRRQGTTSACNFIPVIGGLWISSRLSGPFQIR